MPVYSSLSPSYLVLGSPAWRMCEQIIYDDDNDDEDPSNEMFATSRLRLTFIERCVNRVNENVLFGSKERSDGNKRRTGERRGERERERKERAICLFNH